MPKRCGPGLILQKGYTTAKGVHVGPACVPDRGRPGKGPKTLPTPREGGLGGWKKDLPAGQRRVILKRETGKAGCGTVIKRLTLVRNITSDRATKTLMKKDTLWLRRQPFCRLKSKG